MSYTLSTQLPNDDKLADGLADIDESPKSDEPAQVASVKAAKEAAVVPPTAAASTDVAISVSGHANPDNAPRAGYSNDELSVRVSQAGVVQGDA